MSISVNELKSYVSAGMSVLIEGKHGVGKTSALRQVCDELGWSMWYANMSTIDVNTHLIGIPIVNDEKTDITMVRPHTIDQADVVFLDEINRTGGFAGDVMNAVMELVNDGAINGEKLPNLKAVVAACNPDDGTYNVNPIDPATVDRFDIFMIAEPKVDVKVITAECGNAAVAEAVCAWHASLEHNSSYVSPRRVGRIAVGATKVDKFTENTARRLVGPEAKNLPIRALYEKVNAALNPRKASTPRRVRGGDRSAAVTALVGEAFAADGTYVKSSNFFGDSGSRRLMVQLKENKSTALLDALVAHEGFPNTPEEAAIHMSHILMEEVSYMSVAEDYLAPLQSAFAV